MSVNSTEYRVTPLIGGDWRATSETIDVEDLAEDAVERGDRVVHGGARDGRRFEPTLLADIPTDARIVQEEQFGPVAAVVSFEEWTDARSVIDAGDYALDACVFTNDYDRALGVAEDVDAGAVRINGAPSHGLGDIPYGGNRDSGIGREGFGETIQDMVRKKSIVL